MFACYQQVNFASSSSSRDASFIQSRCCVHPVKMVRSSGQDPPFIQSRCPVHPVRMLRSSSQYASFNHSKISVLWPLRQRRSISSNTLSNQHGLVTPSPFSCER
eukprot:scpid77107/ scgid32787/ 